MNTTWAGEICICQQLDIKKIRKPVSDQDPTMFYPLLGKWKRPRKAEVYFPPTLRDVRSTYPQKIIIWHYRLGYIKLPSSTAFILFLWIHLFCFLNFYWSTVDLKHWVSFKCTAKRISYILTNIQSFFRFFSYISSVQSFSHVQLFVTPWIAARQASLSINISQSSVRLTYIESVMPSSHLILGRPLLLLPSIPPSIRVFS